MTTRLQGPGTTFLPFDQGDAGGAGNPVNPAGHHTAYLGESVWDREGWLEVLGRYLVSQRDRKKQIQKVIADEAHSSQTGKAASKLKAVLSAAELADLADGGEVSTEGILAAQMTARVREGPARGRGTRHHLCCLHRHAQGQDPGREWDQQEVVRDEALKGIMRWVRLHPYNTAQKVQTWWSTSGSLSRPCSPVRPGRWWW